MNQSIMYMMISLFSLGWLLLGIWVGRKMISPLIERSPEPHIEDDVEDFKEEIKDSAYHVADDVIEANTEALDDN